MENIQIYWDQLIKLLVAYTPKFVLAVLTLIIGLFIIKRIVSLIKKLMSKKKVDLSLQDFLSSLTSIILKTILIISVISMVGIETTSFVAILATAGFAIGMALQGSLGNFAGGVLILFFKPYKVGDFIESQGYTGVVQSIQIFNTIILTPDNKRIILPNAPISNGAIINYTAESMRRVDFNFGIGYNDNINKAKKVIQNVCAENTNILEEPSPMIAVGELSDSSVNITVRVWAKTEDYWNVFFDLKEKVKKAFDENGITIPYPQTEVHIHQ